MQIISAAASAAIEKYTCEPVLVISITHAGETRYLSDTSLDSPVMAETCIIACSEITDQCEEGAPAESIIRIRIADPMGSIYTWLQREDDEGNASTDAALTVWQCFRGLSISDLIPLASGRLTTPCLWQERNGILELHLSQIQRQLQTHLIGQLATREIFPALPEKADGQMLPIVIGKHQRVEAVPVTTYAQAALALPLDTNATQFIVDDARLFPSGSITVRVGEETMTGNFSGNTFTITARPVVASSTILAAGENHRELICPGLTSAAGDTWVGYLACITSDGREQYRRIIRSESERLFIDRSFLGESGDAEILPSGTAVTIRSYPTKHVRGERVTLAESGFTLIVAGHASGKVHAVEGWGRIIERVHTDGVTTEKNSTGRVPVPMDWITINTNDTSFGSIDGGVTSITLPHPPSAMDPETFLDDRLFVTLDGYTSEDGIIEHPVDALNVLLCEEGGMDAATWDMNALRNTRAAREQVRCAFVLTERTNALSLASDMADQMATVLRWRKGKLALLALSNLCDESQATWTADDVEWASIERSVIPESDRVTEAVVRFQEHDRLASVSVVDNEMAEKIGTHTRTINGWMLADRASARWLAEFWVRHLRDAYEDISVTLFHHALPIEAGDTVTLDRSDLFDQARTGQVIHVEHTPAAMDKGDPMRVRVTLRSAVWEGCTSSCEHACESGTCESSGCELSCTTGAETGCVWTCETSCQSTCELSCTARAETRAQARCSSASAETGCQAQCQVATVETIREIRQVKVTIPPDTPRGTATAIQIDARGNTFGDPFSVRDPFDLHPTTYSEATAYLNFHNEWVFIPSSREVKLVRVISDLGDGAFEVQEEDRTGTTWGNTFTAWSVS